MKLIPKILQYASTASSHRLGVSQITRNFSIFNDPFPGANDRGSSNKFESADDFERRVFGEAGGEDNEFTSSFLRKLEKSEKARERFGTSFGLGNGNVSGDLDDQEDFYNTLNDGVDEKLKEAAFFDIDEDEVEEEDYTYRPDINIEEGMVFDTKILDVTKPGAAPPVTRDEFETTTREVLEKADFRNVRFLANFLTEAGIIIKRNKTGISAKAQRRIAREIKTARAFGLMPFTCMGTKEFAYGKSMDNEDDDMELTNYRGRSFVEDSVDPLGP